MPKLINIRFSQVGHPDARLHSLKIPFTDPEQVAMPQDTVISLPNGGGKSSMIQLFYSIFKPRKNDFVGGKAEGETRKLDSYFKSGEVAFVVTEWSVDNPDQLSFGERPTRVLGYLAYKTRNRDESGSYELQRHFFSFKTGSALKLDDIPFDKEISFAEARDWINNLSRQHPKAEIFSDDRQERWIRFLQKKNFHPGQFTLLTRMNQKESEAHEILKLKTTREFVDMVLDPLIDVEKSQALPESIEQHRGELENLSKLEDEHKFSTSIKNCFEDLKQPADEFLKLKKKRLSLIEKRDKTAGRIIATRSDLDKKIELQKAENAKLKKIHQEALGDKLSAEKSIKWLVYRSRELSLKELETQEAEVRENLEKNTNQHDQYLAARHYQKLNEVCDKIEARKLAISEANQPAEKTLNKLNLIGSILRQRWIEQIKLLDQNHRAVADELKNLDSEQDQLKSEQAVLEEKVRNLSQLEENTSVWLAKAGATFESLEAKEVVKENENGSDAKTRIDEEILISENRLNDISEELENIQEELIQEELEKNQAENRIRIFKEEQDKLKQEFYAFEKKEERIAGDKILCALESTDKVNLYDSGLLERLRASIEQRRSDQFDIQLQLNNDREDLADLENNSVFPPARDVKTVLRYLDRKGITAFSYGEYLAENMSGKPEDVRGLLNRDPSRYGGIVFQDEESFTKAQKVKTLSSIRGPVQLSLASEVVSDSAERQVILPETNAAFDRAAAQEEQQKLKSRIDQNRDQLRLLSEQIESTESVLIKLTNYLEQYSADTREEFQKKDDLYLAQIEREEKLTQEVVNKIADYRERQKELKAVFSDLNILLAQQKDDLRELEHYSVEFGLELNNKRDEHREQLDSLKDSNSRLAELPALIRTNQKKKDSLKKDETELSRDLYLFKMKQDQILYSEEPDEVDTNDEDYTLLSNEALNDLYQAKLDGYEKETETSSKLLGELSVFEQQSNELFDEYEKKRGSHPDEVIHELLRKYEGKIPEAIIRKLEQSKAQAQAELGAAESKTKHEKEQFELIKNREGEPKKPEQLNDFETLEECREAGTILKRHLAKLEQQLVQKENSVALADAKKKKLDTFSNGITPYYNQAKSYFPEESSSEEFKSYPLLEELEESWNQLSNELSSVERSYNKSNLEVQKFETLLYETLLSEEFEGVATMFKRKLRELRGNYHQNCAAHLDAIQQRLASIDEDLLKMEERRSRIVAIYSEYVNEGINSLNALNRSSRFPENDGLWRKWSNKPFIKVQLDKRVHQEDFIDQQLCSYLDRLLRNKQIKLPNDPATLIKNGVHEVVKNYLKVRVFKVSETPTGERFNITDVSSFSGGEKITTAIAVYMSIARLIGQKMYQTGNLPNFLILDNPLGACNHIPFIQMQREMARVTNIQLIYFSGVNDPATLGEFPRLVTLKNKLKNKQGDRIVTLGEPRIEHITAQFNSFEKIKIETENQPQIDDIKTAFIDETAEESDLMF